jgi:hypothetical protein
LGLSQPLLSFTFYQFSNTIQYYLVIICPFVMRPYPHRWWFPQLWNSPISRARMTDSTREPSRSPASLLMAIFNLLKSSHFWIWLCLNSWLWVIFEFQSFLKFCHFWNFVIFEILSFLKFCQFWNFVIFEILSILSIWENLSFFEILSFLNFSFLEILSYLNFCQF